MTTGAVRILKGQDVLPDCSTLQEHGITDGDTVNIVIEPDRKININVTLGPKTFTCVVKHSLSLGELKVLLISNNQVALLPREFSLAKVILINDEKQHVKMNKLTMPLHYYEVGDTSMIDVVNCNAECC